MVSVKTAKLVATPLESFGRLRLKRSEGDQIELIIYFVEILM